MKNRKVMIGKYVWLMILCWTILAFASTVSAQPAWSRGEQLFSINYDECMRRAKSALMAEGYGIDKEGGAFITGKKEIHTAVIMCNVAPEGKFWVNIVVASVHTDEGVPGAERVKLQGQMGNSGSCTVPNISGTYATTGDPVGIMVIDSQNGNYIKARYGKDENSLVNRLEGSFKCGVLTGSYTNTVYNATGTFEYTFSPDGTSFTGKWWNSGGGSGTNAGTKK